MKSRPWTLPWTLTALATVVACGSKVAPSNGARAALPPGVVAVVAGDGIDARTVERVAAAQGITTKAARDRVVADALFAASARERLGDAAFRRARRSALARALLESLAAEAARRGPPTDAEVAAATERRWWDLDRPPMLRTTHAIVVVKKPEDDKRARALADRIALAVQGIAEPAAFRKAAMAVPASGLEVHVEDLDPVARDNRSVNPDAPPPPGSRAAEYSPAFVDAAFAIPAVGSESPVVKSEFGYHVILAVALIPEHRVPLEERRHMLEPEILNTRETELRDRVLAEDTDHVDVERSAFELTEQIKASP